MIPQRVLVVEDERIIALTIRQMLEERGYEVVGTAATAHAAIRLTKLEKPDIVLMDIHLEGKPDGIEAARQIEADSGTPVVFLTAYAEDETIRRAARSNSYSYLVKPVQAAELHATLQIALSKHGFDKKLKHSENRLRLAMDAASLAVWDWDRRGEAVETAGDMRQLLGCDGASPYTLNSLFAGVLPADRLALHEFVVRAPESEASNRLTFRCRATDDSIRWIQTYARAYPEAASGTVRTIGTLQDVTQQCENELRLRQAAALFDNIADGIIIANPGLHITAVNPAFLRITGYTQEAVAGLPVKNVLPEALIEDPTLPPGSRMRWQGETWCTRADGTMIAVWMTVAPVKDNGTMSGIVFSFSDITPLRRAEAELDYLAHHDPLTGLPNRLLFNEHLDGLIRGRPSTPFFLYLLDLDRFKLINDSRGHSTGDLVLQAVSERLRNLPGEPSFAARLGGDEFVILSGSQTTNADSLSFGQTIGAAIAVPMKLGSETLTVTASIGISGFPESGMDRQALVLAADAAMYEAKREGPNCCRIHDQALVVAHTERYEIEQGIRHAAERSQLQLLYQPTISLRDGSITGAEALVRWLHPERGLLSPALFIPVAEDAGLIEELGEAVLRMACRDWAHWLNIGGGLPRLSVNVSARQMTRGAFPEVLRKVLEEFSLPPSCVEIEITESALRTLERGQTFIRELKVIGVTIAIDDFGTGYSSLATLRDLPVDRIKTDRRFIPSGLPGANDSAMMSAIVGIAHAMNLQLTAEGIETRAHLDMVSEVGCDEAQGFWFGQPMAFSDAATVIAGRPFEIKR